MKIIVCPTDFSPNSLNACNYAIALAKRLNSKIILVHAYENPVMYTDQPLASIQLADEQVRLSVEKKLTTLKLKLQKANPGVAIESLLNEGSPHEQLAIVTDQYQANLIVMGATGTSKLERLLAGSTTSRIIRNANCPVFCIPKGAHYKGINKIIFSTDLQEDNISAASSIAAFAKNFDAEIIFLYVDDKHLIHSDEEIVRMTAKIRNKIKYPKISGYITKDPHITKGINTFLKRQPADILVMFTHRKHFPESLFHPSITKMMSHQTSIPLLSMKHSDETKLSKA
jgi:nucleotide-binding universal stress UspA family protein